MSALGARCRTRAILRERALAAALVSLSVLAIGRSTKLCEGTGGEADPAAANTARRSHRWRSPSSSGVFAATATIATRANRVCTCRASGNTCFEQECVGADKRLIPGVHVVGFVTGMACCCVSRIPLKVALNLQQKNERLALLRPRHWHTPLRQRQRKNYAAKTTSASVR